jgi:hypothetical protein
VHAHGRIDTQQFENSFQYRHNDNAATDAEQAGEDAAGNTGHQHSGNQH